MSREYTKPRMYRVCIKCDVFHVEDCRTCFGFGLRGDVPISAYEAEKARDDGPYPGELYRRKCPECGGTIHGNVHLSPAYLTTRAIMYVRVNGGAVAVEQHAPH